MSDKAIKIDCYTLMNDFIKTGDYTFVSFASKWLQHEFHGIFYGFRTVYERLKFIETIIDVVTGSFLFSDSVHMQIAALYLYYALYHKQPLQNFVKMRITLLEMDKLLEFHTLLKTKQAIYADPWKILSKLLRENAFLFVANSKEIYLNCTGRSAQNREEEEKPPVIETPLNLRLEMNDIFDPDEGIITRLNVLESAYNEMKESLGQTHADICPSEVTQSISAQLEAVALLLDSKLSFPEANADPGMTTTEANQTRKDRVLEKISSIQRSKNTLQPEQDDEPIAGPSPAKKMRRGPPKKSVPQVIIEDENDESISIDVGFMKMVTKPRKSFAQNVASDKASPKKKRRRKKKA